MTKRSRWIWLLTVCWGVSVMAAAGVMAGSPPQMSVADRRIAEAIREAGPAKKHKGADLVVVFDRGIGNFTPV